MPQLTKLLLLAALLILFPTSAIAQKSARKTRKPSPPPVVCEIDAVPKGMVVVGYKRNSACSDGAELVVKWPANGDIICTESPLPPQFSIVSDAQGRSAGTCPGGAYLIVGSSASARDRTTARNATTESRAATERRAAQSVDDDAIGRAFASHADGVQVTGEGTVTRLLSDDLNGSRHQRFIIELASGQTLLVSHNIDLAPRLEALEVGDNVRFSGEYAWNEKGGVIHWTHRDPRGRHVAGWLIHNGRTYQ
jgi:hypothetical protein